MGAKIASTFYHKGVVTKMDTVILNNGVEMPMIGIGTSMLDEEACERTVREALDLKAIDLIPEEDYPRLRDEMKACIAAVRKTDMTNEDMLRHDLEFHNIIRRAANNDILLNICVTLTGTIYDERRVLFTHTNYVEQSLWEHNRIANAFGSLDVNQVRQAYIAHLATTRSSIELTQPET